MKLFRIALLLLIAAFGVSACKEEVVQDLAPREVRADTIGHYCQMLLIEHDGPNAQVHLEGVPYSPLFFSQVRDAIAYARAPEQMAPILAIHVNDMGREGASWENPGEGNWIDAEDAFYVVGSARQGGMGASETVPFLDRVAAEEFARAEGGKVLTLAEIPDEMVLAPADMEPDMGGEDDEDYLRRLRALSAPLGG